MIFKVNVTHMTFGIASIIYPKLQTHTVYNEQIMINFN